MGRKTPQSKGTWKWYRVSHQKVRRVRNARGSFGVVGMDLVTIRSQDLPCTLAHVIKHSLRATLSESVLMEDHYIVHDCLCLGRAELTGCSRLSFQALGGEKRC